ncbi:hypothetical protein A0H81_08943 [Grifola frondosa]|uniref:Uncharacterized protein n=1 Tax=Grifola frondosa TaxID=5627 RepID=A0A1C7M2V3_GRIFR|nr:hypothetical protein A0H81_08943 [Grifola frondosa]
MKIKIRRKPPSSSFVQVCSRRVGSARRHNLSSVTATIFSVPAPFETTDSVPEGLKNQHPFTVARRHWAGSFPVSFRHVSTAIVSTSARYIRPISRRLIYVNSLPKNLCVSTVAHRGRPLPSDCTIEGRYIEAQV